MGQRGPAPTPVEVLKLRGTYRKGEHADRGECTPTGKKPLPLEEVGSTATWLWDHLMTERPEWLDITDTVALRELCDVWEMLCECRQNSLLDPSDRDNRLAFATYHAAFERLAAKFGLTPGDRSRIMPTTTTPEEDEADRLLA